MRKESNSGSLRIKRNSHGSISRPVSWINFSSLSRKTKKIFKSDDDLSKRSKKAEDESEYWGYQRHNRKGKIKKCALIIVWVWFFGWELPRNVRDNASRRTSDHSDCVWSDHYCYYHVVICCKEQYSLNEVTPGQCLIFVQHIAASFAEHYDVLTYIYHSNFKYDSIKK